MNAHRIEERDAGFTLVELMITAALLGLVLTLVGGVLIQGLRIQSTVQESTAAASSSQLAAESLARGVNNSLRIDVKPDPTSPGSTFPLVRSVSRSDRATDPAGSLVCQAWVVVNKELRTIRSTTPISVPTSAADVQNWTLLATGVEQTRRPDGSLVPVFTDLGNTTIDVAFTVDAPRASPVLVDTRLSAMTPDPTAGLTCF